MRLNQTPQLCILLLLIAYYDHYMLPLCSNLNLFNLTSGFICSISDHPFRHSDYIIGRPTSRSNIDTAQLPDTSETRADLSNEISFVYTTAFAARPDIEKKWKGSQLESKHTPKKQVERQIEP